MGIRRQLGYPPYYFTVGLTLSHKDEETAVRKAYEVMDILRSGLSEKVQILGPTPKPIARTHNLYHYQILLKYRFEDKLQATLNQGLVTSRILLLFSLLSGATYIDSKISAYLASGYWLTFQSNKTNQSNLFTSL